MEWDLLKTCCKVGNQTIIHKKLGGTRFHPRDPTRIQSASLFVWLKKFLKSQIQKMREGVFCETTLRITIRVPFSFRTIGISGVARGNLRSVSSDNNPISFR
jgi:hypothetical protein